MGFDLETIFDISENKCIKKIEFIGIDSGDYESQCFDVDKETFEKLNGHKPTEHDKSYFNKGTYRYCPFSIPNVLQGRKYKIKIEIEEIK